jgi:hypothetical protein
VNSQQGTDQPGTKITIVLTKEREDKGDIRFESHGIAPGLEPLRSLYLSKAAVAELGDPNVIAVTIEASGPRPAV